MCQRELIVYLRCGHYWLGARTVCGHELERDICLTATRTEKDSFCTNCEPQILEQLQTKMTKATHELSVAQEEADALKAARRQQLGDLRREYLKYHGYLAQLLESQDEPRKILSGDALRYLKEFHGDMERCAEYRRPLHNRRPRVGGMDGAHFYNKYRFLDNRQPVYVDAEAENKRKTLLEEARRYYMTIHCPTVPEAPTWDELMNSMSGTSDGTAEDFVQ